ncbi:MAG: hypothetical protein AAFP18_06040 [Bacteroidota bacterium]
MHRTFTLLCALIALPVSSQTLCALPSDLPDTFGLTASRTGPDLSQLFHLDQMWANLTMLTSPSSGSSQPEVRSISPLVAEPDSVASIVLPLYRFAYETICSVRFPSEDDPITVTYDAPVAEIWVEIGDASLGTRLNADALPDAAVALFGELERLVAQKD